MSHLMESIFEECYEHSNNSDLHQGCKHS